MIKKKVVEKNPLENTALFNGNGKSDTEKEKQIKVSQTASKKEQLEKDIKNSRKKISKSSIVSAALNHFLKNIKKKREIIDSYSDDTEMARGTFYLPQQLIDDLEDVWLELRKRPDKK